MKKPEKKEVIHREDGECGCKYLDNDFPCRIKVDAYNSACDNWEKYVKELKIRLEMAKEKAKEQYQQKWDILNSLPSVEEIYHYLLKGKVSWYETAENISKRIGTYKKKK